VLGGGLIAPLVPTSGAAAAAASSSAIAEADDDDGVRAFLDLALAAARSPRASRLGRPLAGLADGALRPTPKAHAGLRPPFLPVLPILSYACLVLAAGVRRGDGATLHQHETGPRWPPMHCVSEMVLPRPGYIAVPPRGRRAVARSGVPAKPASSAFVETTEASDAGAVERRARCVRARVRLGCAKRAVYRLPNQYM